MKRIKPFMLVFLAVMAFSLSACANARAPQISYNGAVYFICGGGEGTILKKCGLPYEITSDLAGDFIGYLDKGRTSTYQLTELDTGTKLFEYGPGPNENVYIVLIDGRYYAAIRNDAEGYHGLNSK